MLSTEDGRLGQDAGPQHVEDEEHEEQLLPVVISSDKGKEHKKGEDKEGIYKDEEDKGGRNKGRQLLSLPTPDQMPSPALMKEGEVEVLSQLQKAHHWQKK
jgi:hypothetical protein